ncbi:hypothetical protein [Desulfosporosinus nitroreducens]|uniref:DUF4829 domain-containing protein n=1 Tax=Desulfosporosinus nitroreducens TaxID=2018668 RepID=A0ABT8QJR4_9FIRM|nr:hypothetical protein [Desulfosporosinus nitroreducens]MCO1600407.1 hypothetical protein [Desulfosporosinus nitroreducens]MDO0821495.1 hypothetical protein [Desulfosporosinus nitroreducens]
MRQSRYVWLIGISLLCLMTIVVLKTPQAVISTLADPHYGNSQRTTIQQFWKYMDLRQIDLARDLVSLPKGSADESEFKVWETLMNKDPMLSLQKVEFMNPDLDSSQDIIVRVSWTSSLEKVQQATFSMSLAKTEKGWQIQGIKQINDLSYIGGDQDGGSV